MEGKYEKAELEDFPLTPLHTSKFPQCNQTNRCWTMFVLSNIAKKKFGDEHVEARKHRFYAETLCPKFWIDMWDEQVEENRFPGQHLWADDVLDDYFFEQ